MLEHMRGFGHQLVQPLAQILLRLGITPDQVTWFGTIAACCAAIVLIPTGQLWQAALLIGFLSLSDTLDGAMARLSPAGGSTWGAFLDSSLDRAADGMIFGSVVIYLAIQPELRIGAVMISSIWPATLALIALVLGQLTSYVKARADALGVSADGGPGARADRVAVILVALLLQGVGIPYALIIGLVILVVLGVITVMIRMRRARQNLTPSQADKR